METYSFYINEDLMESVYYFKIFIREFHERKYFCPNGT